MSLIDRCSLAAGALNNGFLKDDLRKARRELKGTNQNLEAHRQLIRDFVSEGYLTPQDACKKVNQYLANVKKYGVARPDLQGRGKAKKRGRER